MNKIIFIADSWGYTKGGINSFNIDLCKSVSSVISSELEIICIVPHAKQDHIKDASNSGIKLIPLHDNEEPFNVDSMSTAKDMLLKNEGMILWVIGHDVITGNYANQLRDLINKNKSSEGKKNTQAAIINHMDYETYYMLKIIENNNDIESFNKKVSNQEEVLLKADSVFAVGSFLEESAEDKIKKKVIMLIPGLDESIVNPSINNKFKVITFGRMKDIIKQCELTVQSFGKAIKKNDTNDRMINAILTIIGLENNSENYKQLKKSGDDYAERSININPYLYVEDRQILNSRLADHSLCIMPSLREGFGLAGWEAIGKCVPVIISRQSGLYKFLNSVENSAVNGSLNIIDISGRDEDKAKDIENLSNLIIKVFNSEERSKNGALELRNILIKKGYLWEKTAKDFLKGLDIFPSPFKYLEPFSERDEDFFYGRDSEATDFLEIINKNQTSFWFYGKSGVGKTSFIKARIIPKLQKSSYDTKISRLGDNVFGLIKELDDFEKKESVKKAFFIDHFEELFIKPISKDDKDSLLFNIEKKVKMNSIKIILIIRDDFLSSILRPNVTKYIPFINNDNTFELSNLSLVGAKKAIQEPFKLVNSNITEDLLNAIVSDLKFNDGTIFPLQLQIIAHTLYKKYCNVSCIDIKQYEESGKIKGILNEYLDLEIEKFTEKDRFIVKEILKNLVNGDIKASKNKSQLVNIIRTKYKDYDISEFNTLINRVVNSRLIIQTEESGNTIYDLTHEYLIQKIKDWIGVEKTSITDFKDYIINDITNYEIEDIKKQKEMEPIFKYICKFKNQLSLNDSQSYSFLINALLFNYDIDYWLGKNIDNKIVYSMLKLTFDSLPEIGVKCRIIPALLLLDLDESQKQEIYNLIWNIGKKSILYYYIEWSKKFKKYDIHTEVKIRTNIEAHILNNMTFVEEGVFLMGREEPELTNLKKSIGKQFFKDETILHEVKNVGSFLIDKYLVSNADIVDLFPENIYSPEREKHPATSISLDDAKKYAEFYDKEIPNEIMWEKAARGTDGRLFPWGNEWDINKCNTKLSGIDGTTEVDKYPSGVSPYGCYDMAGNVWEWTTTPKEEGKFYIVRGGSWSQMNILPWCAYKFNYNGDGQQNVGFRCVRVIKNDLENSDKVYFSGGVVINVCKGRTCVLLSKNSEEEEWRLPKGMLKNNEKVRECAIREVQEKTGYKVNIDEFIDFTNWSYVYQDKIYDETVFIYLMRAENPDSNPKHDSEFEGVQWIDIEDVQQKTMYNNEKNILLKGIELYKNSKM